MWILLFYLFSSLTNDGNMLAVPALPAPPIPELHESIVPERPEAAESWRLEGIRLGDGSPVVEAAWGEPTEKTADDAFAACETWAYADGKSAGLCDGAVTFVRVANANGRTINVNGSDVALTDGALKAALGRPAFVAEDGWVIVRDEDALKVFEDGQGNIESVDLFWGPCGA